MARHAVKEKDAIESETRRRLIEAATREFASAGYEMANINRISTLAGFARGTVYNYFPSKRVLLVRTLEVHGHEHVDYVSRRSIEATDPVGRLRLFFEAGFEFIASRPLESKLLLVCLQTADSQTKALMGKIFQPLFRLIADEILAPGTSRGAFLPLDPATTATLIMTFYLGAGSQVDEGGRPYLPAADVADFAIRAISRKAPPTKERT
jgi:AcrR family transcriptional regulator